MADEKKPLEQQQSFMGGDPPSTPAPPAAPASPPPNDKRTSAAPAPAVPARTAATAPAAKKPEPEKAKAAPAPTKPLAGGKRIFVIDDKEFEDPDPNMDVKDVRESFESFFPDIRNADANTSLRGPDLIVEFARRVGTKGTVAFTAVILKEKVDGKAFGIGEVTEGIAGYWLVAGQYFYTYGGASAAAQSMNEELGLDARYAFRVVASSMVPR